MCEGLERDSTIEGQYKAGVNAVAIVLEGGPAAEFLFLRLAHAVVKPADAE